MTPSSDLQDDAEAVDGSDLPPGTESSATAQGDDETQQLLVQVVRGLVAAHARIDVLADKLTEACERATRDRLDRFTDSTTRAISSGAAKTLEALHSEMEQARGHTASSAADIKRGLIGLAQALEYLHGQKLRETELGKTLQGLRSGVSNTQSVVSNAISETKREVTQGIANLERNHASGVVRLSQAISELNKAVSQTCHDTARRLEALDQQISELERRAFVRYQWVWVAFAILALLVLFAPVVFTP